jgi:hypothetical protein
VKKIVNFLGRLAVKIKKEKKENDFIYKPNIE